MLPANCCERKMRVTGGLRANYMMVLGSIFAALKIDLDVLSSLVPPSRPSVKTWRVSLSECLQLVERCLNETRTLSHLLHPPLLDEAGFHRGGRPVYRWFFEAERHTCQVHSAVDIAALT